MDNILFADIAGYLYEDMQRMSSLIRSPFGFKIDFTDLSKAEKSVWEQYASGLKEKLQSLGLIVRPYKDFCRTCIITEQEIEYLLASDHIRFSLTTDNGQVQLRKTASVESLEKAEDERWFFRELNYLIPLQIKRMGYEIVRPEEASEIDQKMIKKLARAIHSRYLKKMRETNSGADNEDHVNMFFFMGDSKTQPLPDFDDLPEEIKYSNNDNAYHIPTKLLSVGYKIRALRKGYKSLTLRLNSEEIEIMARVEHLRWSWDKRLNGWIFGNVKDNSNKIHPGLIPYEELSEPEKDKDRELVRMIPALLQDIGYEAYHVNPDLIKNISYALKPQSSIYRILRETREMNDQIRKLVVLTPGIEEMVRVRNSKIEEAITEIRESYTYAHHIQETFLPDGLYVRECFPESFVLFKPKDIVSGDFYFFSRQGELMIFAAADCTGHGIPGALISTIGYGILDQAVNEVKLTDPSDILYHLYSRVHRFLRHDVEASGVPDDMDIALCVLNTKTNTLTYSGVKSPLYIFTNGEQTVYHAQNLPEGCVEKGECRFISDQIKLRSGDTIYLGSDGYADQFGGENHKKYQTGRFKEFLKSIQEYSMPEQSDMLYEEIECWREVKNEDQTDDILVIGIKV
jgi:serine phosphatase RsbU (regulator of sigma subunit)